MLDRCVAVCLVPLGVWMFVSGLDDLALNLACLFRWLRRERFQWPTEVELETAKRKPIAVFVPLWNEHTVIHKMLERNMPIAHRYGNCHFFVGSYPNDARTLKAVQEYSNLYPNVHVVVCPHDGPTFKADCLNWIYEGMLAFEEQTSQHFEIVVNHDAEDVMHPESLHWVNYFAQMHDVVQIPVLPLRKRWFDIPGVYCDEFAEFQIKELPTREFLGGFVPFPGVGTAFSRCALQQLAQANKRGVFASESLTEDYEAGFRLHSLQARQIFLPVESQHGGLTATVGHFPDKFLPAVRQRTRWTIGIALQSWEQHGWRVSRKQLYWLWRDRKGLVGNVVSPLAFMLFLYGLVTGRWAPRSGEWWNVISLMRSWWWLYIVTFSLGILQLGVRTLFVKKVYGSVFATGVLFRAVIGHCINFCVTVCALYKYFTSRISGRPLVWAKTEHAYPTRAELIQSPRLLGQELVRLGHLTAQDLESALLAQPAGLRIGEYLVQLGKLKEREVYAGLSKQQNMPVGKPPAHAISRAVTRALPAEFSRKWKVLPYKVLAGRLFVVGPELPCEEMSRELRQFSSLEIRFQLVTPSDFNDLASEFLPSCA